MITLNMTRQSFISPQDSVTLWTLIRKCVWKMLRLNMVFDVSKLFLSIRAKLTIEWTSSRSLDKLLKIIRWLYYASRSRTWNYTFQFWKIVANLLYWVKLDWFLWLFCTWRYKAQLVPRTVSHCGHWYENVFGKCFDSTWFLTFPNCLLLQEQRWQK